MRLNKRGCRAPLPFDYSTALAWLVRALMLSEDAQKPLQDHARPTGCRAWLTRKGTSREQIPLFRVIQLTECSSAAKGYVLLVFYTNVPMLVTSI
jgi:hypothetical protein